MRNIGMGSWGEDVKTLQQLLNQYGYSLTADGIFGQTTKDAIMDFQNRNADETGAPLVVDGIVGPKTWWALTHVSETSAPMIQPRQNTGLLLIGLIGVGVGLLYL